MTINCKFCNWQKTAHPWQAWFLAGQHITSHSKEMVEMDAFSNAELERLFNLPDERKEKV